MAMSVEERVQMRALIEQVETLNDLIERGFSRLGTPTTHSGVTMGEYRAVSDRLRELKLRTALMPRRDGEPQMPWYFALHHASMDVLKEFDERSCS